MVIIINKTRNLHPPGYNYLGPFTGGSDFKTYLQNTNPTNDLDYIAMQHDIAYNNAIAGGLGNWEVYYKWLQADKDFIKDAKGLLQRRGVSYFGKAYTLIAIKFFELKVALGQEAKWDDYLALGTGPRKEAFTKRKTYRQSVLPFKRQKVNLDNPADLSEAWDMDVEDGDFNGDGWDFDDWDPDDLDWVDYGGGSTGKLPKKPIVWTLVKGFLVASFY